MKVTIYPSVISGELQAPFSKSYMQRALAAALLRDGETEIIGRSYADDDLAALEVIQKLGGIVKEESTERLLIYSEFLKDIKTDKIIDASESGLSFRMFSFISALYHGKITIKRSGTLQNRNMDFLKEYLPKFDVSIIENVDGDLQIQGPFKIKDIEIDKLESSQYLTGLLFAYSKILQDLAKKGIEQTQTITVNNLKSKPYIDLTLDVMEDFGMLIPEIQDGKFVFNNKNWRNKNFVSSKVETDWSGASFLLVAAAIAGEITIKGLNVFSKQADKKILEALQDCGCILSISMDEITVKKNQLKAFHFDALHCPDLFPPLVALAAHCSGTSVIEGVHRLFNKESNRAESLMEEFKKMGISIKIQDDKMIIEGGEIKAATTFSHGDHRIAMAIAVASLAGKEIVSISHAEAVSKSYQHFFEDLKKVNAKVLF